ncbi:hypothetical protein MBLNU457_g1085t1 [Dothideomycetes sp. NU457]
MEQKERIQQEMIKRYGTETNLAGKLLDLGHKFGVTERVLDSQEVEQFLDAFTRLFISDPKLYKVFLHISNTLATRDLPEVFDIVHGIWMKDLITAEHCWIDEGGNPCNCDRDRSDFEGIVSDGESEEEDLDDIADEVNIPDAVPGAMGPVNYPWHWKILTNWCGCKIMQSIEALMLALDEVIEPENFRERARRLPFIKEDSDSETVSDAFEDKVSEAVPNTIEDNDSETAE